MAAEPRSEVEALRRSFRSRVLLLLLLIAAGLAAAVWAGTRDEGRGEPEDRRRLLLVTAAGSEVDYYAVLERGGFEIEVDRGEDWAEIARAALPDSEATGLALLLEFADERGFGFVVLEQPGSYLAELEALAVEPAPGEFEDFTGRDYAALSVGDLSFPHHLGVDEPGEPAMLRLPGYGALQALYAQPAITARAEPERPTVEELQFEADTRVAREMVSRPGGFPVLIESAVAQSRDALDDDPGVISLLGPLQTGSPIPDPDGGVLLFHHDLQIYSDDAQTLEIDAGPIMRIDYLSPEALAGDAAVPVPCTALAGGELALDAQPRIEAARDGGTMAIAGADGEIALWRKRPGPGCDWQELGEVPGPALAGGDLGVLAPRLPGGDALLLARVVAAGDVRSVQLWLDPTAEFSAAPSAAPKQPAGPSLTEVEPGGVESLELLTLAGVEFGRPAFVDAWRLAVLSSTASEVAAGDPQIQQNPDQPWRRSEHAVHLLDRRRPGAHLQISTADFAGGRRLRELAIIDGRSVLLTARNPDDDIELIELRIRPEAFAKIDARLATARSPDAGEASEQLSVDAGDLEVRVVLVRDSMFGVGLGPGEDPSTRMVVFGFSNGPEPAELALLPLAGGEVRVLTDNLVRDDLPRFSADGRALTFVSMTRMWISQTAYSVPRLLVLSRRE